MRGTSVPSSLVSVYDLATPIFIIAYGPSQFSWNFPAVGSAVFSKTFLNSRSLARNICFTCLLYEFVALYWYDAMHTAAASQSSSGLSKSFVMASILAFSAISV